ncbi:putative serine protein kinase PrkA [Paucimonas lemoignei]|uniref:Putative serine protein kinase PrkA n=1 Tax=Paucimonas lemoignei TaxID=29443 RepID=A0A4R3I0N2_PAULE|nr:serine protein kinase [Paucimonas lemoignei]TCS39257.1 putative serine protein kinase PrkA [Paucimonas lemoignei]
MMNQENTVHPEQQESFLKNLVTFAKDHHAQHWEGKFGDFLEKILPGDPYGVARTSHQYIWDMIRWSRTEDADGNPQCKLFQDELFGVDESISRVMDYFKAAAAGSEVGRRLLLLLGPPSGGKSTLVILLKRGLEEYSYTDAGAMYGIAGCPVHESPLHLVPHTLRPGFRDTYGVEISGELCPFCRSRLENEYEGDFMRMPVERIFISEAGRSGIGTYAPHDPTTADLADLVGSVDLSKVAEYGDEGDPRAWSWSGAVYAASRGMLEMIEILKVKREFLYLLLTLTQEKNVKVSRFPLIYLDETILAHTNLAEFRKFLQESENEALLDRMVIIQVPYTLNYKDEARIYRKLISSAAPAFREVHLDPHVLHAAAVFATLTRLQDGEEKEADLTRRLRIHANEEVEGFNRGDGERMKQRAPDEGLAGVSPRFVINALSNAIIQSDSKSLTTMDVLLALKDAIENDARIDPKKKRKWVDYLVLARKNFYNRWVKEDVYKALFVSFEQEAQDLLDKYLDEVEASLDSRPVRDPITNEERKPDERFLRTVEETIHITDSGKQSFRQEVVRKAMGAFKRGEKFTLDSHALLHEAVQQYLFEQRRDVLRLVSSTTRPDEEVRQKISVVEQRLVQEYGYDAHSAREALNYVTTLLAQE